MSFFHLWLRRLRGLSKNARNVIKKGVGNTLWGVISGSRGQYEPEFTNIHRLFSVISAVAKEHARLSSRRAGEKGLSKVKTFLELPVKYSFFWGVLFIDYPGS
jgi:hypothetical protein